MRIGVALSLVLLLSACGSSSSKPEPPLHVSTFELQSKLLGKQLDQVLVTPQGGGKGRPLLVFLHGYGGTPAGTLGPAFVGGAAPARRPRAGRACCRDGQVGWWHDRDEGRWGSYVLDEVIPAALARSGADPKRIAVGGISMGGFGALDLGRHRAEALLRGRRPFAGGPRRPTTSVRLRQRGRLRAPRPDRAGAQAARPTTRRSGSTSATMTPCGRSTPGWLVS